MVARSDIHPRSPSPPSSLRSPPSFVCHACVYKMLIERHSSSVVVVVAAWGLGAGEGERGWDDMDSRDILLPLLSVSCFPTMHGEFGPWLVWIGKGSTDICTLQKMSYQGMRLICL